MVNLVEIDLKCSRYGDLIVSWKNLAGLTPNHLNDALAFSAPAFLAHQLSVLRVRTGQALSIRANEYARKTTSKPTNITAFLNRFVAGIDIEQVPKSFDLSISAKLVLFSKARRTIRVLYKPKLGPLARFPEERSALLVANYLKYVLEAPLPPYSEMVPVAINHVANNYDHPDLLMMALTGNAFHKELGAKMTNVSLSLYQTWQTQIHEATNVHNESSQPKRKSEIRKKCKFCAELILYEAIVCKHCGRDQPAI